MAAAHQFSFLGLALFFPRPFGHLFGKLTDLGASGQGLNGFFVPVGDHLPQKSDAENSADGNVGGTDRQAQTRCDDHGDSRRKRDAECPDPVELGDLFADDLDHLGPV